MSEKSLCTSPHNLYSSKTDLKGVLISVVSWFSAVNATKQNRIFGTIFFILNVFLFFFNLKPSLHVICC